MRNPFFRFAVFGIVVALVFGAALRLVRAQTPSTPNEPQLKLQGIDGRYYDVAEMRGSVVLVSFGATWCTPCSGELIALEELQREYQSKPVKSFWVSIESSSQISDGGLKRYAREHKLTFPVLRDPTKTTFLQFSPRVRLPMIVFFDKKGHADASPHFGMSSPPDNYKNAMRQRLDKLLATARSEVE
ncbi:MAG TPA: TlpA disulfide reductase family protein [Pyrinomonadaceae bacterium]|nr:TlpA disulfide reductase family protein [Pyrinomonadaceae bacterium]